MVRPARHPVVVSFGGKPAPWNTNPNIIRDFTAEMLRLFASTLPYGLECVGYDEDWLRAQPFYEEHRDVFGLPRFGLLFKPYTIASAIANLRDGDYLLWADSNMVCTGSPQPILDICDQHGAFIQGHKGYLPNALWTRRDAFVLMGCDTQEYWDAPQCKVSLLAFKASPWSRKLVSEWLRYCCDPRIADDARVNECGTNLPGFRHGRAEQAALSLLRQKYGIPLQPQSTIFRKVDPV